MSTKVTAVVWAQSKASGVDRLVLLAYAWHADRITRECWPSNKTVAREINAPERMVRRSKKELIRIGELQLLERGSNHKSCRKSDTLKVGADSWQYDLKGVNKTSRKEDNKSSFNKDRRGTMSPGKEDNESSLKGDSADPLTVISMDTKDEPKEKPARKRAVTSSFAFSSANGIKDLDPPIPASLQTPEFTEAWSEFDKHRRNGKARKEWTAYAKRLALRDCEKFGPARAVAAIEHSILNGWKAIYEPKSSANSHGKPKGPYGRL